MDIYQLGMCCPVAEDDPDRTLLRARCLGVWVEACWERGRVDEALRYADEVACMAAGARLDVTGGLSVEEVGARLLQIAASAEAPAPTPPAVQRPRMAPRATPVLWICGARAVGESAVGWRVFQRLLGAGVRPDAIAGDVFAAAPRICELLRLAR